MTAETMGMKGLNVTESAEEQQTEERGQQLVSGHRKFQAETGMLGEFVIGISKNCRVSRRR